MVEGARLEIVYTAKPYRGFESLSLRQLSFKELQHSSAAGIEVGANSALTITRFGDTAFDPGSNPDLIAFDQNYIDQLTRGFMGGCSVLMRGQLFSRTDSSISECRLLSPATITLVQVTRLRSILETNWYPI